MGVVAGVVGCVGLPRCVVPCVVAVRGSHMRTHEHSRRVECVRAWCGCIVSCRLGAHNPNTGNHLPLFKFSVMINCVYVSVENIMYVLFIVHVMCKHSKF